MQELTEADKPKFEVTRAIPHNSNDHYDPGTIRLCRIFEWLKYRAWTLLKEINEGQKVFLETKSPDRVDAARRAFGEFMKDRDGFGAAIYTFKVRPVENNDGFVVSARISAKYLNPEHSSATVH